MKKVAVIMGSDSDWPVVKGACEQLKQFGIPFEAHIFPRGPHAMATATDETAMAKAYSNPHIAQWIPLCMEWLKEEKQV